MATDTLSGSFLESYSSKRQTAIYMGSEPEMAFLHQTLLSQSPASSKRNSGEAWWRQSLAKSPAPRSSAEWKAALGTIKREYMNRRFRQCSLRCQEILDNKSQLVSSEPRATTSGVQLPQANTVQTTAHPVHLVYLRFYAATSLEMQGRAMHHSSPHRANFLKQAYEHYAAASELAKRADERMARPGSSESSEDFYSAASGLSSAASTRMSSPTPSAVSVADSVPKKKKVAFREDPVAEPIIRPDSPTLGFDEWLGRSSPEPVLPESILKKAVVAPEPEPQETVVDVDPFFHARAVHRYCDILDSIRRQISSHMTTLDIEIAACRIPTTSTASNPELRSLDLRARIERLRAAGWRRPRFDVHRYEQLREDAMADMLQ